MSEQVIVLKLMSEHAIYLRMIEFTKKAFGTPMNPHSFRRIGATTISLLAPEQIETARALLGHTSRKTTQDSYIAAESIIASRRQGTLLADLRRRLPGRIKSPNAAVLLKKRR